MGNIYVADLSGGRAGQAMLLSSQSGQAAVVFKDLIPSVTALLNAGTLDHAARRRSTGVGDYQAFFLTDTSCEFFSRRTFATSYTAFPAAVAWIALTAANNRRAVPYLRSLSQKKTVSTYVVALDGASTSDLVIEYDAATRQAHSAELGPTWSKAQACPSLSLLDRVADRLREHRSAKHTST
jgi:hypothetical protein